jgi:ATP-dependent protease HslVU (ClpYQ) ATPase subunit
MIGYVYRVINRWRERAALSNETRDKVEIKVIIILNPTRLNSTELKVDNFD